MGGWHSSNINPNGSWPPRLPYNPQKCHNAAACSVAMRASTKTCLVAGIAGDGGTRTRIPLGCRFGLAVGGRSTSGPNKNQTSGPGRAWCCCAFPQKAGCLPGINNTRLCPKQPPASHRPRPRHPGLRLLGCRAAAGSPGRYSPPC